MASSEVSLGRNVLNNVTYTITIAL